MIKVLKLHLIKYNSSQCRKWTNLGKDKSFKFKVRSSEFFLAIEQLLQKEKLFYRLELEKALGCQNDLHGALSNNLSL